jgi:hypothetical protein
VLQKRDPVLCHPEDRSAVELAALTFMQAEQRVTPCVRQGAVCPAQAARLSSSWKAHVQTMQGPWTALVGLPFLTPLAEGEVLSTPGTRTAGPHSLKDEVGPLPQITHSHPHKGNPFT